MARVWPVRDGNDPANGYHWVEVPFEEAVGLFGLKPNHFHSDLKGTSRYGGKPRDLRFGGYTCFVVEVEEVETAGTKWRPGFYVSPVAPGRGFELLVRREVVKILGNRNVEHVTTKDGSDFDGEAAIHVNVVLTRKAAEWRGKVNPVEVSLSLIDFFDKIGETRRPIVRYLTKAERAELDRAEVA